MSIQQVERRSTPVSQTNIQDLPEDCFTQVMIFAANAPKCTRVCKSWQKYIAERCYPHIFYDYRGDIKISRFMPEVTPKNDKQFFEAVKQTYRTVMKSTHALHIQAEMKSFDRSMPLALGPVVEIIEDANLVKYFFENLNIELPNDKKLTRGSSLGLARQSAIIRNWMKDHPTSFDQLSTFRLFGSMDASPELGITTIPQEIGNFTSLGTLFLSHTQLTTIPEQQIFQLKNLTRIHVQDTADSYRRGLVASPESNIGKFARLRRLDFIDCPFAFPSQGVFQLTNLTALDLSGNRLAGLPQDISRLTNLNGLNLSFNRLRALPEEISQLTNLAMLSLSYNELNALPQGIFQLTKLTRLAFHQNQLIPSQDIGKLTNLDRLTLGNIDLINLQQHPLRIGVIANSCAFDKIIEAFRQGETEMALNMFRGLPTDIKNGIYGELYNILRPIQNDYYGFGEHAFLQLNGQNTSNDHRVKAIQNFVGR